MNLSNLNRQLASRSEMQAKRLLEIEGRRLERIALRVWRQYLNSYTPNVYAVHLTGEEGRRTYNSEKAIKLGKVRRNIDGSFGIELTWINDLVYHDSVMSNQPQGHAVMLISDGWSVSRGKHKDTYRFGYYEGFNYIEKVEKAYNAGRPQGISLEVQWSGKYLR